MASPNNNDSTLMWRMKKQLKKNKAGARAQAQAQQAAHRPRAGSKAGRVDWAQLIQSEQIDQTVKLRKIAAVVENGKDINSILVGAEASTLLHLAAEIGDMMIVSQLLSHNANVNQADRYGRTPLLVAVQNETGHYVETASLLLCAKADPRVRDERGRTALHVATANRNAQLITQLALPKGQPDPVSTQASPPSVYE